MGGGPTFQFTFSIKNVRHLGKVTNSSWLTTKRRLLWTFPSCASMQTCASGFWLNSGVFVGSSQETRQQVSIKKPHMQLELCLKTNICSRTEVNTSACQLGAVSKQRAPPTLLFPHQPKMTSRHWDHSLLAQNCASMQRCHGAHSQAFQTPHFTSTI